MNTESCHANILFCSNGTAAYYKELTIVRRPGKTTKKWLTKDGRLHRKDGPAIIRSNGTKEWWLYGMLHRIGGPAIERKNSWEWYQNGLLHRIDGPAKKTANNTEFWYYKGIVHREDGPAIIRANGDQEWRQRFPIRVGYSSFLHRIDGPALVSAKRQEWRVRQRRHREDGPAIITPKRNQYYLNHVLVPQWLVETPAEDIDPLLLSRFRNAQVRAEFVRKIGIERCWYKLAVIIDEDMGYELGTLPTPAPFRKSNRSTYLKMQNPSVPELWHVEGVSNQCETVQDALRWRMPKRFQHLPFRKNGARWYQQGDVVIVPKGAKCLRPYPEILT